MEGSTQTNSDDWILLDSPPISPTLTSSLDESLFEAHRLHLAVNPLDLFRPTLRINTTYTPMFPDSQSLSPDQIDGVPRNPRINMEYANADELEAAFAAGHVAGFDDFPISPMQSLVFQTEPSVADPSTEANALSDEDTILQEAYAEIDALFFNSEPTVSNAVLFDTQPVLTDVSGFNPEYSFDFPNTLTSPESGGTPVAQRVSDVFMGASAAYSPSFEDLSTGDEVHHPPNIVYPSYLSASPAPQVINPCLIPGAAQTVINDDLPELNFSYCPVVDDNYFGIPTQPLGPAADNFACAPRRAPEVEFSNTPIFDLRPDPHWPRLPIGLGANTFNSPTPPAPLAALGGTPNFAPRPLYYWPPPNGPGFHSEPWYGNGVERQQRASRSPPKSSRRNRMPDKVKRERRAEEKRDDAQARLRARLQKAQAPPVVESRRIPLRFLDDMPLATPWRLGHRIPDGRPGVVWYQSRESRTGDVFGYWCKQKQLPPSISTPAYAPAMQTTSPQGNYLYPPAPQQVASLYPTLPMHTKRPAVTYLQGNPPKKIVLDNRISYGRFPLE